MKLLALVCTIFFNVPLFAMEMPKDSNYEYKLEAKNSYPQEISNILAKEKFTEIKEDGAPFPQMGMSWLSRIFIDAEGRVIMSKAHVKIDDKIKLNEIYTQDNDFVYHHSVPGFDTVAFYFLGYKKSEVQSFVNKIEKVKTAMNMFPTFESLKAYGFLAFPVNAYADDTDYGAPNMCNGEKVKENLAENDVGSFTDSIWGCIKGAGASLWNVGAGIGKVLVGAGNILTGNGSEVWSGMKSTWNNITTGIGNISGLMNQVSDSWKALSSAQKAKLTCEVISSMGIMAFTAGAIAPAAVARLASLADKLAKTARLDKATGLAGKAASKVGGVISPVSKPVGSAMANFAAAASSRAKAIKDYIPKLKTLGVDKKLVSDLAKSEAKLAHWKSEAINATSDMERLKRLTTITGKNRKDVMPGQPFGRNMTVEQASRELPRIQNQYFSKYNDELANMRKLKDAADKAVSKPLLDKVTPQIAQDFMKSKKAMGLLLAGNACALSTKLNPEADIELEATEPEVEDEASRAVQSVDEK